MLFVPEFILYEYNQLHKERNVLFNDALNTFYLRLYGVSQLHINHVSLIQRILYIYIKYIGP